MVSSASTPDRTRSGASDLGPGGCLLAVEGLSKSFPGLRALADVSLRIFAGEIVSLVGQNGSGKSTLVKVLAGVYEPDSGATITDGRGAAPRLRFIHQDLGLVGSLSTIENLSISRASQGRGLAPFHPQREHADAVDIVGRFGGRFDVRRPVHELSASERAIVAIARAIDGFTGSDGVLVLDEPTAALPDSEVERLFAAVRSVAASGAGVIFISHHLDEVLDLSDRVVALRDGRVVADLPSGEVDHDRLVSLIVGRKVETVSIVHETGSRPIALHAQDLYGDTLRGVDLEIGEGEIVGVAGLLGSGREELARVLFGAASRRQGTVLVGERTIPPGDPAAAIDGGMALVPADRVTAGAVMAMTMRENLTLPDLLPFRRGLGRIDRRAEREVARTWVTEVDLHPPDAERPLSLYSGGNQQKVVLAKWLRLSPRVLLLDEPTQGVDVGAKAAIYSLIGQAASRGTAVLVCSSDTRELAVLCSRVLVLRQGATGVELAADQLSEERLTQETIGGQFAPAHPVTPSI